MASNWSLTRPQSIYRRLNDTRGSFGGEQIPSQQQKWDTDNTKRDDATIAVLQLSSSRRVVGHSVWDAIPWCPPTKPTTNRKSALYQFSLRLCPIISRSESLQSSLCSSLLSTQPGAHLVPIRGFWGYSHLSM